VGKKNDKTESDPSLDLVASDLNLARLFVAIAKSARDDGNLDESQFARSKAMKYYCEAFRLILQMQKSKRQSFWSDLQSLSTQIRWLSIHTGGSRSLCSEATEDAYTETLSRLLREGG
jgi:hypothetical protein